MCYLPLVVSQPLYHQLVPLADLSGLVEEGLFVLQAVVLEFRLPQSVTICVYIFE